MVTRKRVSKFKFESSSTPGTFYTVTVEGESYDCTCPGFVYRKKCSHLEKAKNQKQIEPADEEEMAKGTSSEKLRKNLFPKVKIDPVPYPIGSGKTQLNRNPFSIFNDERYTLSLADEIADKSCRAAEMLGEIGDKSAVKPLIRLLNGEIEDHLYRVLCTNDYEYDLIRKIELDATTPAQLKAYNDITTDLAIRFDEESDSPLSKSKFRMEQRHELSELLYEYDYRGVERTIVAAAEALGKIGDKRVIEPLIQTLGKIQGGTQRSEYSRIHGSTDAQYFEETFRNALVKLGVDEKKLEQYFPEEEVEDPKEEILAYLSHVKSSLKDSKVSNDLKKSISKLESSKDWTAKEYWKEGKFFMNNLSNSLESSATRCQRKTRSGRCRRKVHGIYCHSHLDNPVAKFFDEFCKYNVRKEAEGVKGAKRAKREAKREAKRAAREAKRADREAITFWRKAEREAKKIEKARAERFRSLELEGKTKKANFKDVETNLVESTDNDWVSATKTRNYINKDPIVDWLDLYGDKLEYPRDTSGKYDENLDFVKLLFRKGNDFEEKVIDYLKKEIGEKHFVTVAKNHLDSRHSTKQDETLQHMKSGVPFILQGVLRNSDNKTYGMPDIMVRSDWLSELPDNQEKDFQFLDDSAKELGDYHYRIIDVKFTTLTYNADGQYLLGANAYKSQLAIYNMALGKLQGYKPSEAYLLGRNWKRTKAGTEFSGEGALDKLGIVDFFNIDRGYEKKAEEAADWIRKVRREGSAWTESDLRSHNIWPNCNNTYDYPWHNAKMQIANNLDELTRVWQIGPKERSQAHKKGIFSWKDSELTPEKMGIKGSVKSNIMKKMLEINNQDKYKVLPSIISNNDRNWQNKSNLEFFVDFETVSNIDDDFSQFPKQGGQELVFMIGCGYEKNGEFEIEVFTAKNLTIEEEARIMTKWFDYMDKVKNEIDPEGPFPKIFHWSPAELTFMGVAKNNFEGDEKQALETIYKGKRRKMITNWKDLPWFDFLKVMKDEPIVVKDAFGFGLKAIAKNLEKHGLTTTTWEDGPTDGLGAMVGAWHCDKTRADGSDMIETEIMQGIREYNIIDCKAMWDLINYLRKNHV